MSNRKISSIQRRKAREIADLEEAVARERERRDRLREQRAEREARRQTDAQWRTIHELFWKRRVSLTLLGTFLTGYPFLGSVLEFNKLCRDYTITNTGNYLPNEWLPFLSPEGWGDFVIARCSGWRLGSAEIPIGLAIPPLLWFGLVQVLAARHNARTVFKQGTFLSFITGKED